MRQQRWSDADLLLSAAQELSSRRGAPNTIVVLNHGLVGLHRRDLESIAAITPAGWSARFAASPPFLRPALELHELLAAFGRDAPTAVEDALAVLEAYPRPLPEPLQEPIGRLVELAPEVCRARIAALLGP